jgi:hypothetical protein
MKPCLLLRGTLIVKGYIAMNIYIDYYAWVTLKTYLPVKRIGNKFLKLPRHNDRYNIAILCVIALVRDFDAFWVHQLNSKLSLTFFRLNLYLS